MSVSTRLNTIVDVIRVKNTTFAEFESDVAWQAAEPADQPGRESKRGADEQQQYPCDHEQLRNHINQFYGCK